MTPPLRRRILHVIDPANPEVGGCTTALLAELTRSNGSNSNLRADVLLVGPSRADTLARSVALQTADRLTARGSRPWTAVPAFRRYCRQAGPFDLVHAWSLVTLVLACVGSAATLPKLVTLTMGPADRSEARWLQALVELCDVTVIVVSNAVKRAWVQSGVNPSAVHVVRPGIDFARIHHDRRDTVRRQWAIDSDRTLVVAVLSHPSGRTDAVRAARIVGHLRLGGQDAAMVIGPGAYDRTQAYRMSEACRGGGDRLIVDDRIDSPWMILPACDAVLVLGDDTADYPESGRLGATTAAGHADSQRRPGTGALRWRQAVELLLRRCRPATARGTMPGVLPMLWAAAAGTIVVGEAGYAVSEIIEHQHSGLLAKPGDDGALVQHLRALRSDPDTTWRLRDTARSEAFSFFSKQRFSSDLTGVHEQIIRREPVSIPDLPVTGGLMFSGRA